MLTPFVLVLPFQLFGQIVGRWVGCVCGIEFSGFTDWAELIVTFALCFLLEPTFSVLALALEF